MSAISLYEKDQGSRGHTLVPNLDVSRRKAFKFGCFHFPANGDLVKPAWRDSRTLKHAEFLFRFRHLDHLIHCNVLEHLGFVSGRPIDF